MGVCDLAVAIEQVGLGNRPATVGFLEELASVEQDDVRQLLAFDEFRDPVFRLVPCVDRDDAQPSIAVFFMERLEVRSLRTTGPSPDGPKAEQDDVAFVLREHHALPGNAVELEVRSDVARAARGYAADGREARRRREQ